MPENAAESQSLFSHFMKVQKLLGAYVYVTCLADSSPPLSYRETKMNHKISSKTYNFLQNQELSRI